MKKIFNFLIIILALFGFALNINALQGGENPDVSFRITNDLNFFDIRSSKVVNGMTEIELDWIAGDKLNNTDLQSLLNQTPGNGSSKGSLYLTLEVALNSTGNYKTMKYVNNMGAYDPQSNNLVYSEGTKNERSEKALTFNFWPYGLRYEIKDATTGNFRGATSAELSAITSGSIKHQLAQLLDIEESEVANYYLDKYRFSSLANRFFLMRYDFYDAGNVLLNEEPELYKIKYNRITPKVNVDETVILNKGAQYQFEPTVTYGEGNLSLTSNTVLYKSSNSSVVTVNESGKITAIASGTATIKAYLKGWEDIVYSNISITVNDSTYEIVEKQHIFEVDEDNLNNICANELEVYKSAEEKYKLTITDADEFLYSWEIDEIENIIEFNPKLNILDAKDNDDIKDLVTDTKSLVLSFEHEGDLPGTAKVTISVKGIYSNGEKINLYYYNDTTKKVELISENLLVANDSVEIEIAHCSKYLLTKDVIKINNPATGDNLINLIIIGGISLIGIFSTSIYLTKKKRQN